MVNSIIQTSSKDLSEEVTKQIRPDIEQLNSFMQNFIQAYENHERLMEKFKSITSDTDLIKTIGNNIKLSEGSVLQHFFNFQNAFNVYLNKKIYITYVFIGPGGRREIRIADNNMANIEQHPFFRYLQYNVTEKYRVLSNEDYDSSSLDDTAKVATDRYNQTKKNNKAGLIFWKIDSGQTRGYTLTSVGPINEAYVNFYVHQEKLNSYLIEQNIEKFVTHPNYGVIAADTASGFLMSDVEQGNVGYAVKGKGGGIAGMKNVYVMAKQLGNLNILNVQTFIDRFIKQEEAKKVSLIHEASERLINDIYKEAVEKYFKKFDRG